MSYKDNINQSKQKVYEKAVATKILDLMDKLRMSNNENNRRRWIWELLQNAKDVKSHERGSVDIIIDLKTDEPILYFKHNGRCFSSENITFLIEQVSTKERSDDNTEETTGKFGTGFLTTHLLSEIVEVKGIIKDDGLLHREFCILLDRSGSNLEAIMSSVGDSIEQLYQLENADDLDNYNESEFNTTFTYHLDQDGLNTATIGIEDLESSLPLTLVYLPSISSVYIRNKENTYRVIKSLKSDFINDLSILFHEIEVNSNGQSNTFKYVTIKGSRCEIALPISQRNSVTTVIDSKERKIPRIFCDFPLIGSEKFGIPFFINSSHFHPTEPRDGIFLTNVNNAKIEANKRIVITAVSYYLALIDYAVSQHWEDLYYLADISVPTDTEWLSQKWFRENVLDLIQSAIYTTALVSTEDGSKIALKRDDNTIVDIPFDEREKIREAIWDLVNGVSVFRVPRKKDIHQWYRIFKNKIWEREHCLDLSLLSEYVSHNKTLKELSNNWNIENPVGWLNQYFDVLQLAEKEPLKFLQEGEYSVIPNQYGELCLPNSLQNDSGIENVFKDIGKKISKDYYKILADSSIKCSSLLPIKTQESVINEINNWLELDRITQEQKRAVCHALTRLFPTDDSPQIEKRNVIYSISVRLFGEAIPEKKVVHNWNSEIWKVSDRIQAELITEEIASFSNLHNLSDHLSDEQDEICEWLSNFVTLIVDLDWIDLLGKNTPILPNQNGTFCDLNSLFVEGEPIDEDLKDISSSLRQDFREELIDKRFEVPIPNSRKISQEKIGKEIRNLIEPRLSEVPRTKETQRIFDKLVLWMNDNSDSAEKIFGDLYKNRHKLYDDDQVAENLRKVGELEARVENLSQENHSLKQENQFLKDEKKELQGEYEALKGEYEKLKAQIAGQKPEGHKPHEPREIDDDFLITYGVSTQERLEEILRDPEISRKYSYSSGSDYYSRLEHVLKIINRAKQNVRQYLESLENYDCKGWRERGETYITGVLKQGKSIEIIIRPSDNRKVIFFYPEEKEVLSLDNSELWVENGIVIPRQITLGFVLKNENINQIDLPSDF